MKTMKRVLSVILAVGVILSSIASATTANAATNVNEWDYTEDDVHHGNGDTTPLSTLLTLSDYQMWNADYTDDNWDALQPQLRTIVDGAYNDGVEPDYMLFGGDFTCLNSTTAAETGEAQVMSILQEKWPHLTYEKSILIQGNHDPEGTEGISPTGAYYFKDFIIYVLNEDDFPTKQGSVEVLPGIQQAAADLKEWLTEQAARKETRPILIASHTSLHYDIDRTDGNNQYAYVVFDAINEAAKQLDVIFFFGHNHTNGDEQVGGSLTFMNRGDKLNVCTETSIANRSGTPTTLNFTYMNYGYIGYIGDITNNPSNYSPTDLLTISELSFYNDRIEVKRYSANGLEEDYNGTVIRKHANTSTTPQLKKYEVYYEARGGKVPLTSENIYEGSYIINRSSPTREGYTFAGYKGDNCKIYQPGDEIIVSSDVTLRALWKPLPDGSRYVLTETLKPDKDYIMIWNSELTGNSGTKYALTANGSAVKVTTLSEDLFLEDDTVIFISESTNADAYVWTSLLNENITTNDGYVFQNADTGTYLSNANTTLSLGTIQNSFDDYTWLYRNYNGYNQLAMYHNTDRYIRYSVSGGNVKLGTKATSTDVNNSSVFLYEYIHKAPTSINDTTAAMTELKTKLVEAKKTAESYTHADLTTAITAATSMVNSTTATNEEIYDMISTLRIAIKKALNHPIPKPIPPTPNSTADNFTGNTFTFKNINYKVTVHTDSNKTVTVTGMKKKLKTVNIPATVKYNGLKFKVTAVQKNAFKGKTSIKKAVIGANVKSIGAKAFYGCKNLKNVTIKNKKIGKIKKNVFKKIAKNAVIKKK